MSLRVALATSCGDKKHDGVWPAGQLYKSPRIIALNRRKSDFDLFILRAEYGLVSSLQPIHSYNRLTTDSRTRELAPQVAEALKNYDWIVYSLGAGPASDDINCATL